MSPVQARIIVRGRRRRHPRQGRVAIALAAALAPARLIIAGMDLYEHPAGAYPADPRAANAYPLMHDRETELAIIGAALGD